MAISELLIQSTLKLCIDPNTGKDFVSGKSIKNIQINGNNVSLDVVLGYPAKTQLESLKKLVLDALSGLDGIGNITVNIGSRIVTHKVQQLSLIHIFIDYRKKMVVSNLLTNWKK